MPYSWPASRFFKISLLLGREIEADLPKLLFLLFAGRIRHLHDNQHRLGLQRRKLFPGKFILRIINGITGMSDTTTPKSFLFAYYSDHIYFPPLKK